MKCCNCEKEFESLINVDGDLWCEKCIEDNCCIAFCEDCGEYHYDDNMYYINDINEYVCESCARNGDYFQCHDCGDWYTTDYANSCYNGEFYVCDGCVDNQYTYVECCDTYIDSDDVYYDEEDDFYCCEQHYHEDKDIYDYHRFSNWEKQTLKNEDPPFCIGFELEVENTKHTHSNNNLARFAKNNYPVICSKDGSIDYGFEIVSHPLSYNYIVENQDKLKYMLEELANKGCESHNPGTCGLHFHVTHPHNDDIIDRIILIMETYKEELIAFSRRTSGQIEQWCKFLSDIKEGEHCKSLYFIKKNKETSTRYMALNLTNHNTIEFRLFRGTLNFDTFMASVELVNNIVTLCSNLEIPVEEITWDRLTETQFAHTYCDMKNIRSTIIPHNNDDKYIEEEKKLEKLKKKVGEFIDNDMFNVIRDYMKLTLCGDKITTLQNEIYCYRRRLDVLSTVIDTMNSVRYWCNSDATISYGNFVGKCNLFLELLSRTTDMGEVRDKLINILEESE